MKIKILLIAFFVTISLNAQKKKNGNIYINHPAIEVIENLHSAMNANDSEALSKIISDDFKGVSGEQMNKDAEPQTKAEFINRLIVLILYQSTIMLEKPRILIQMQWNIKMKIFQVSHGFTAGSILLQWEEQQESIILNQDILNML